MNFINDVENYCCDSNIDIEEHCTRNNHVMITGDITLDKIGALYRFFKDEYKDIKIEFIDNLGLQYCFKISKS